MDWYLAPSLAALFREVDARWPHRDHGSDGAKGDAAHAGTQSDHNPDWSAGGVVRAIDVDKDGIVVDDLLAAVVGDHRVWYVIWNRRIASATYGWVWKPYAGSNPHTGHVHISIKHTYAAETDRSSWLTKEADMPLTDADVEKIVDHLLARKIGPSSVEDCLSRARALALRFGEHGDLNTQLDQIQAKP